MRKTNNMPDLHKTTLFKLALYSPLIISALMVLIILRSNSLVFDFTELGLIFFIAKFKYAMFSLGAIPPLLGLVAVNYRSNQLNTQIKSMNSQNTFTNYFKHREEFFNLIKAIEIEFSIIFSNSSELYRLLFPHNSIVNINITSTSEDSDISDLMVLASTLKEQCEKFNGEIYPTEPDIKRFYIELWHLTKELNISIPEAGGVKFKGDGNAITSKAIFRFSKHNNFEQVQILSSIFSQLADFCHLKDFKEYNENIGGPIFNEIANELFEPIIDLEKKSNEARVALEHSLVVLKQRCKPLESSLKVDFSSQSSSSIDLTLNNTNVLPLVEDFLSAIKHIQNSHKPYLLHRYLLDKINTEEFDSSLGEHKWTAESIWHQFSPYAKCLFYINKHIKTSIFDLNESIYSGEQMESLLYMEWYEQHKSTLS